MPHFVQAEINRLPSGDANPAGQSWHVDRFVSKLYEPRQHGVHSASEGARRYVPGLQQREASGQGLNVIEGARPSV